MQPYRHCRQQSPKTGHTTSLNAFLNISFGNKGLLILSVLVYIYQYYYDGVLVNRADRTRLP